MLCQLHLLFLNLVFLVAANGWYMLRSGFRGSVPVRQDGTIMRESAVANRTNPALKYVLCYGLFGLLFSISFYDFILG